MTLFKTWRYLKKFLFHAFIFKKIIHRCVNLCNATYKAKGEMDILINKKKIMRYKIHYIQTFNKSNISPLVLKSEVNMSIFFYSFM